MQHAACNQQTHLELGPGCFQLLRQFLNAHGGPAPWSELVKVNVQTEEGFPQCCLSIRTS